MQGRKSGEIDRVPRTMEVEKTDGNSRVGEGLGAERKRRASEQESAPSRGRDSDRVRAISF